MKLDMIEIFKRFLNLFRSDTELRVVREYYIWPFRKRCEYSFNKAGERHGTCQSWYDDGQLKERFEYVNSNRHGTYQSWHTNGHLLEQCEYMNGNRHGTYQCWYNNGHLLEQYEYVNDCIHGIRERWTIDGSLCSIRQYDHGVLLLRVSFGDEVEIAIFPSANFETTALVAQIISDLESRNKEYVLTHHTLK